MTKTEEVRFLPAGDTAVVVEYGECIDRTLSERVLRLSTRVRAERIPGVIETVPTYRSLLVHYSPLETDHARVVATLERLVHDEHAVAGDAKRWRIPVCFDEVHAPDLREVSERSGLSVDEILRIHTETPFHVYMVGFSPGFAYMGDLPAALALPRRTDPRTKVPAGSLAIAIGQLGIYPVESPGGWHLIGATPIRMFDVASSRPALLAPGDKVRFERISASEFDRIRAAPAEYRVASERITA